MLDFLMQTTAMPPALGFLPVRLSIRPSTGRASAEAKAVLLSAPPVSCAAVGVSAPECELN